MSDDEKDKLDLSAWQPQSPPSDFAEKVLARVRSEEKPATPTRSSAVRRWGAVTLLAAGLAAAAAMTLEVGPPAQGEAIAKERTEVSIGRRARAVLEAGAEVKWNGDDVTQAKGDVFYRVEPGAKFRVHTPAGDVEVKGTCFLVKVTEMNKQQLKSGAIGAGLTALAFVAVYEGRVAVSHAGQSVDLKAGESAQAGHGVTATGAVTDGQRAYEAKVDAALAGDPTAQANENLVEQVGEYRKRLEMLAEQKRELEGKLQKAEEQVAATGDGGRGGRPEYDLNQEDWAELAKKGEVKYRVPCPTKEQWKFSAEKLRQLGLAPEDGQTLRDAYERSYTRLWSQMKPLCIQAVGNAEVVDKIGPVSCPHIIHDVQLAIDEAATREAHTQAAEIRAGLRPEPGPGEKVHPVTRMFLILSDANRAFEADLAKSFGPDEAHRLVNSDGMCTSNSRWGGGKKRE